VKDIYFIECGILRKGEYHICEYCKAKMIRRLNGQQRYCSIRCSLKSKQKQTKPNISEKHVINNKIIFFNEPGHGKRKGKKFICKQCNKEFITRMDFKPKYCSQQCKINYHKTLYFKKPCANCGKIISKRFKETRKSKTKNIFCNSSCAASYNNTFKRKSRRSKVEIMLFEMLKKEFSSLKFVPNDKKLLDGLEIDIAIPSLKLGIEWNGIVHHKPIYGQAKLDIIQERDAKKQILAQQKDINLIVITDLVSTEAKVKEAFVSVSKIIRELTN